VEMKIDMEKRVVQIGE